MVWPVIVLAIVLALAGCAGDERQMASLRLPDQPASTDIPCEPLSRDEEIQCMARTTAEKEVCRKVEANRVICQDQQAFVKRLYSARDGK